MIVAGLTILMAILQLTSSTATDAGGGLVLMEVVFAAVIGLAAAHLRLGSAAARLINTVVGVLYGLVLLSSVSVMFALMAVLTSLNSAGLPGGGFAVLAVVLLALIPCAVLVVVVSAILFMYRAQSRAFLGGGPITGC